MSVLQPQLTTQLRRGVGTGSQGHRVSNLGWAGSVSQTHSLTHFNNTRIYSSAVCSEWSALPLTTYD